MLKGHMALGAVIVDDNVDYLSAIRELLERQGMRIVAVASTPAEALLCLSKSRADVVLIDIDLGDESGFDLANALHGRDDLEPPPMIMISAYAEDDVVELLDSSPAIGFLPKSSLSASAIETLLRDRRGHRA
jgi:CheY-like chemotaxis protein